MVQHGGDEDLLGERQKKAKVIDSTTGVPIVRNFVHVNDPVPRILVAPLFSPCDFPCLRWLRKRLLQYQPLCTYYLLDDQLHGSQRECVVAATSLDTVKAIQNRLDRPQSCWLLVHAIDRHSLNLTYAKYIQLLNTNHVSRDNKAQRLGTKSLTRLHRVQVMTTPAQASPPLPSLPASIPGNSSLVDDRL